MAFIKKSWTSLFTNRQQWQDRWRC